MNKVYILDADKVKASVDAQVKWYEEYRKRDITNSIALMKKWKKTPHLMTRRPQSPIMVHKMYQSWIDIERNHYAKARIVRIKPRKYILVYGDTDDTTVESGTGPFKTIAKAQEWFFKQGR